MKKCLVYILLAALLVMLTGCVTLHFSWKFLHGTDQISQIEVFYLEDVDDFNLPDDAVPVALIAPEDYDDFCGEIQNIDFTDTILLLPAAVDPSWYLQGYVVRIVYQNGDFEVICNQGYQYQETADGWGGKSRHYSFPKSFDWDAFVKGYIDHTVSC